MLVTSLTNMKQMRRYNLIVPICFACAVMIVTLRAAITWKDEGEDVFYGLAAPILVLGGIANVTGDGYVNPEIDCYNNENGYGYPEISSSQPSPVRNKSIFFHETSCTSSRNPGGGIVLTARQACAVESAAKMNPDLEVYLLFTSPINASGRRNPTVDQLLTYPNVKIQHLHFERYLQGSPLENWYKNGDFKRSRWPRTDASDLLRYLTLWKYGGTYLDLDVIVTKSLSGLSNFAGAESKDDVAAGVLNFESEGFGHKMAQACLEDLRDEYSDQHWGHNGPGVITRVLKKICCARQVQDMTPERCRGFTVYPPNVFYTIHWKEWRLFFDEAKSKKTMARFNTSIAIHVWNKLSYKQNVKVGSRQPYGLIAKQFCPKVYSHCGPIF